MQEQTPTTPTQATTPTAVKGSGMNGLGQEGVSQQPKPTIIGHKYNTESSLALPRTISKFDADEALEAYDEEDGVKQESKIPGAVTKKEVVEKDTTAKEAPSENIKKVKLGDAEIDLDLTAEITEKLENGKEYTFNLKEAINAKLAQENFERTAQSRVDKIAAKEKYIQSQLDGYNTGIKQRAEEIVKLSEQGDLVPLISKMAEWGQKDPVEVFEKTMQGVVSIASQWESLTPIEKQNYLLSLKSDALSKKEQAIKEMEGKKQQVESETQKVRAFCSEWGVTEDQFFEHFEYVAGLKNPDGSPRFKSPDEVGFKEMEQHFNELGAYNRIVAACVAGNLGEPEKLPEKLGNAIYKFAVDNPEYTPEDLLILLNEQINKNPTAEKLSQKVAEQSNKGFRPLASQVSSQNNKESEEPEDWDSL